MEFSRRLDLFGDEVFATLNARRRELEASGRRVFDLSVGTPDFEPAPHVIEALRASAAVPANWRYSLHDTDELLDAVCAYYADRYGVGGITRDMVMSCRGTQEGLVHVCAALSNPGDVALVPDPCYPVFQNATLLAGARPAYYRLTAEHDFLPHLADVPADVADAARYLIVSLPVNPVGSVGTPEVYEEVIAFAREHGLVVIHDNAYSDIVFDGEAGGSFLSYPGALDVGVEFLSLSKSFNVTGRGSRFWWAGRTWWRRRASCAPRSTSACSTPSRTRRSPRSRARATRSSDSACSTRSAATPSATRSSPLAGSAPTRTAPCSCGRASREGARTRRSSPSSSWSARA